MRPSPRFSSISFTEIWDLRFFFYENSIRIIEVYQPINPPQELLAKSVLTTTVPFLRQLWKIIPTANENHRNRAMQPAWCDNSSSSPRRNTTSLTVTSSFEELDPVRFAATCCCWNFCSFVPGTPRKAPLFRQLDCWFGGVKLLEINSNGCFPGLCNRNIWKCCHPK